MASAAVLQRLQQRALQAERLITQLHAQLSSLKTSTVATACQNEEANLSAENATLKQEVEQLKVRLTQAEVNNGVRQVALPSSSFSAAGTEATPVVSQQVVQQQQQQTPAQQQQQDRKPKKEKKEGGAKPQQKGGGGADSKPVDVSRLDMRVGHIISAKHHPDADSLYVEEVDLGEEKPRTIISGLVKHIPLEQIQNRLAIFTCNLKPSKMRGIFSEGMIMCASTPEKVEIIDPPEGAQKGDCVVVEGYPGEPDAQLPPKKKIWEQVQPDLTVNADGAATYKGALWYIPNKPGQCKAPTMKNKPIK